MVVRDENLVVTSYIFSMLLQNPQIWNMVPVVGYTCAPDCATFHSNSCDSLTVAS